jgi:hypothetical protein
VPPIESKVGYKIVTGWLGLAFPIGKSSGSETHELYLLFRVWNGWYKEKEDDLRVAFVPQSSKK